MKKMLFAGLFCFLVVQTSTARVCNSNMLLTKTDSQYQISSDGNEVTDLKTGLIWQRCTAGTNWDTNSNSCTGASTLYLWKDALAYGASQASSTGLAWRVPNYKELLSIYELSCSNPSINLMAFPNTPAGYFFSSTDAKNALEVFGVSFANNGNFYEELDAVRDTTTDTAFVRLVRGE